MREVKETLKKCRIYGMLKENKRHVSFHTPGHKYGKWDITELSYSDNLSNLRSIEGGGRGYIERDGRIRKFYSDRRKHFGNHGYGARERSEKNSHSPPFA